MIPYITIPDPSQPLYTMNENTQTSNAMNVYLKIKYNGRGINLILYKTEIPSHSPQLLLPYKPEDLMTPHMSQESL